MPYFEEAGLQNKIEMIVGDASEIIENLPGPFELVFIDADKENYLKYFKMVWSKVSPGGYILVDNTLWYGRVLDDDAESDRETAGIVLFNNFVQEMNSAENILLPLRDGIMIIQKKPE
jgi:predicted O-methyltransferase YrrM